MVAYDYPLLNVFWTMLWIFLWIAWLFLLFRVFADIFRNHEMSGWGKALWSIFVILVPFLGVLVYIIAHGSDMTKRDISRPRNSGRRWTTTSARPRLPAAVPGRPTSWPSWPRCATRA